MRKDFHASGRAGAGRLLVEGLVGKNQTLFYQAFFTPADAGKIMRPSGRLNDKLAVVGRR